MFGNNRREPPRLRVASEAELPMWHPRTPLRDFGNGAVLTIETATSGIAITGNSGSGKTSGPGAAVARAYLSAGFGLLILTAKKTDTTQWLEWCREVGRLHDVRLVGPGGQYRFNFLAESQKKAGGNPHNLVSLLDAITEMISNNPEGGGSGDDGRFWRDTSHLLHVQLITLVGFVDDLPLTMELLAGIVASAPMSQADLRSPEWVENSLCSDILREAEARVEERDDPEEQADFAACSRFWKSTFPNLSEKTRAIIVTMFEAGAQPFLSRPLRRLLCSDTNLTPIDILEGRVVIIDLNVAEWFDIGRAASLIWKFCTQREILRRPLPPKGVYLRPVSIFCDESQYFITKKDAEFQAVARSHAAATVYMTQSKQAYKLALKSDDAVSSLLANLSTRFMCACTDETAHYCSDLIGSRYVRVMSENESAGTSGDDRTNVNSGMGWTEQERKWVLPSQLTTLRRGGAGNGAWVDCLLIQAGQLFTHSQPQPDGRVLLEMAPYTKLSINQNTI